MTQATNLSMHTYVSYIGAIKVHNSFTTFNDLALHVQQMCFFFIIYSGIFCCTHFPKITAMHCLVEDLQLSIFRELACTNHGQFNNYFECIKLLGN